MGILQFIKQAVKHPRELSTIFPSSRFLAREIADQIDFDTADVIAEIGAGDGALTWPLVERKRPETELHLIEINEDFCTDLERTFIREQESSNVFVHQESADNLVELSKDHDIYPLDYVVSGIPLTTLPDEVSEAILDAVFEALSPKGRYIQFQYSLDYYDNIRERFGPVKLSRVWFNIFPARVYVADKANAPSSMAADSTQSS